MVLKTVDTSYEIRDVVDGPSEFHSLPCGEEFVDFSLEFHQFLL